MLLEEEVPFEQQWGKIMTSPIAPAAKGWSALVLAGSRPKGDALAAHFGVSTKALIDFDGQPMLSRVLTALHGTAGIERIMVIAQDIEKLQDAVAQGGGASLADKPGVVFRAVLPNLPAAPIYPFRFWSPQRIIRCLKRTAFRIHDDAGDADLAVGMVERAALMERYPRKQTDMA